MVDYSRFDKIDVSDDESNDTKSAAKKATAAESAVKICGSCRKENAALKCSVCRKVSYCDRECQKSDWPYHKRVCSKPKPTESKTNSSGSTAPKKPSSPKLAPTRTTSGTDTLHTEEEDEEVVKSLRGYAYFSRQLPQQEQELLGDRTPVKLSDATSAAAVTEAAPIPLSQEEQAKRVSAASAWNAANTWEERVMTAWAKERLRALLSDLAVPIDGATVEFDSLDAWEGDVNIIISGGKPRYVYDFKVNVVLAIRKPDATAVTKAKLELLEVCNGQEGFETTVSWGSPAPSDADKAAVLSVCDKSTGSVYAVVAAAIHSLIEELATK